MNIQYAVKLDEEQVYIIEANPRASRTVPFVSKAIGVPLAKVATSLMMGAKLKDFGLTKEIKIQPLCWLLMFIFKNKIKIKRDGYY